MFIRWLSTLFFLLFFRYVFELVRCSQDFQWKQLILVRSLFTVCNRHMLLGLTWQSLVRSYRFVIFMYCIIRWFRMRIAYLCNRFNDKLGLSRTHSLLNITMTSMLEKIAFTECWMDQIDSKQSIFVVDFQIAVNRWRKIGSYSVIIFESLSHGSACLKELRILVGNILQNAWNCFEALS